MRLSSLLGNRYKENPTDAVAKSHRILVRGGYIRQVANGIYSYLPLGQMVAKKITDIIRKEMNNIGFQEILMPIAQPKELWEESGRYGTISAELLRFEDRTGHDMVLAMTHEEAVVHLARTEATTYTKYPFAVFQIQTKFRDEARSRGGLLRVREFQMKDAYSFHINQEDLDLCYERCYVAYLNIFKRVGLKNVVAVQSDSGMMGGSGAHEFMLLSEAGEDKLVICPGCSYSANVEVADGIINRESRLPAMRQEEIETKNIQTMEQLEVHLKVPASRLVKACVFKTEEKNSRVIVVFIRGDMEVNEAKLKSLISAEVSVKLPDDVDFLCLGYVGPVGLKPGDYQVFFDESLQGENDMICGANKEGYHVTGVNIDDLNIKKFFNLYEVKEGLVCSRCNEEGLTIQKGIEIGHIFKLGDKYTRSMGMTYVDQSNMEQNPIMGCYGIGIGRLMACVVEELGDERGPNWPSSIAPFDVHIISICSDNQAVNECASRLYSELSQEFEVLLDDRNLSAGIQFAEADLIGVPTRVIISPKGLEKGTVEVLNRAKNITKQLVVDKIQQELCNMREQ